jgi:hypothetical protein
VACLSDLASTSEYALLSKRCRPPAHGFVLRHSDLPSALPIKGARKRESQRSGAGDGLYGDFGSSPSP